jgi:hypothetical protein
VIRRQGAYRKNFGAIHGFLILAVGLGLWLVIRFSKRVTHYETLTFAEAKIYSPNHLSPMLSRPPESRQASIFQPPDLLDRATISDHQPKTYYPEDIQVILKHGEAGYSEFSCHGEADGPLREIIFVNLANDGGESCFDPSTFTYCLDFMGAGHDFNEIKIALPQSFEMSKEELMTSIERQKEKFCFQPSPQPSCGLISSPFGYRISPFTRKRAFHKGIDIASDLGAPIYAVNRGVVIFSGCKGAYGNAIIIHHGFGFSTLYGHNSINVVKSGDKVKRGQLIGYVGNTGRSTASHLHYEVRKDGICVNPKRYLLSKAF